MKLLLRLTPMLLVILGLFLFTGCEDTDDDEDVNPLVGSWDISNLSQQVSYVFVDSSFAPFNYPGDYVKMDGDSVFGLTWTEFSAP